MFSKFIFGTSLLFILGCGGSTTQSEATPAAFNTAGAPTIEFKVPDMMCEESCAKAVHDTLAAQPGAVDVIVDFPNRLATVAVDKTTFDSQAALDALLDKQFSEAKLVGAGNSDTDSDSKKHL